LAISLARVISGLVILALHVSTYFCRLCLELQHLLNYDKVQGKRDLC